MTKHRYIIVVRYLDGRQHGYSVNITDEKSYTLRDHKDFCGGCFVL